MDEIMNLIATAIGPLLKYAFIAIFGVGIYGLIVGIKTEKFKKFFNKFKK